MATEPPAARTIEQPELNSSAVDNATHDAAERVDFSDQMSFRNSPDRGIARHLPDEIEVQRNQTSLGAEASCGRRGLAACVAGPITMTSNTSSNDMRLLPDTKRCEYLRQNIFRRRLSGDLAQKPQRIMQRYEHEFLAVSITQSSSRDFNSRCALHNRS